jgi:predicted nucleic acid-binding protein
LTEQYRKPSRNDCFALALAKQEGCPLLTGDRDLRTAAEQESVLVMGTIWLVTQLVNVGIINCITAREAYDRMRLSGRRLPWPTAEEKLREIE